MRPPLANQIKGWEPQHRGATPSRRQAATATAAGRAGAAVRPVCLVPLRPWELAVDLGDALKTDESKDMAS